MAPLTFWLERFLADILRRQQGAAQCAPPRRSDVVARNGPPAVAFRRARELDVFLDEDPATGIIGNEPENPGFLIQLIVADARNDSIANAGQSLPPVYESV